MNYPGGKGGSGVIQKIINLIPKHEIYIEPFLGGGIVFLKKRACGSSIVIDADAGQIEKIRPFLKPNDIAICGDAISYLKNREWKGMEFVYCDPPYVHSTRTKKRIYQHEMTDRQHKELVSVLMMVPAAVMLSGYRNQVYDAALKDWRRIDYQTTTRGGMRTESIWLNYDPPSIPAELTYLGQNYRERERIKRKKARWAAKLAKLPLSERVAIMEVLQSFLQCETSEQSLTNGKE